MERCRDGRYAVNASRCDVWVVCARLPVCIVACFVGFWGSVFCWVVHPYMTGFCMHFLESAFSNVVVTYSSCTYDVMKLNSSIEFSVAKFADIDMDQSDITLFIFLLRIFNFFLILITIAIVHIMIICGYRSIHLHSCLRSHS